MCNKCNSRYLTLPAHETGQEPYVVYFFSAKSDGSPVYVGSGTRRRPKKSRDKVWMGGITRLLTLAVTADRRLATAFESVAVEHLKPQLNKRRPIARKGNEGLF